MVIAVTKDNFKKEVTECKTPVVLDISASWCGPCQQMKPIFEQVARELGEQYKFVEINVDESRELAIQFGVTSVPTFIFLNNGEIKGKERGYMSQEDLKNKVKTILG